EGFHDYSLHHTFRSFSDQRCKNIIPARVARYRHARSGAPLPHVPIGPAGLPRLADRLQRHALLAQRNPRRPPNAHGDRGAGSLEESLSETHALPNQQGKRFLIISKLTRDYYVVFLYRGVWKIAQRPGPGADQELSGVFG